ncbi:uncharacterized protein LOC110697732 [Chenopodium quinoa]|uniref:uncharacterized protein LOC110697732 n=1 Tax=Chenopodium quinoa TaxID=63459 RepID=UPI000B7989C8|nr:uncharacterized protein LOC110697732 [Chenopodium quinoa]
MADNRTLRELTAPNLNQQPLCIAYQQLEEASGGGLVNKTPGDATRLIAELAENSRQFSQRTPTRRVNLANSNTTELESQRKHRLGGKEKVKVSAHVSAVFQKKLPEKCSDPGMFTVPVTIGDTTFHRAMLDLGASINVFPYSLFKSLELGPLHETGVVIQLADRSNVYPKGVVEDVLVKVNELIFPADFYVLDMEHDRQAVPILLGRPFLKTVRTKIDVFTGSLTIEFDGQEIVYNIYNSMKYLVDTHSLCSIDIIDPIVQDVFDVEGKDALLTSISNDLSADCLDIPLPNSVQMMVAELNSHSKLPLRPPGSTPTPLTVPTDKLLPSVLQAPQVELKPLPDHLKYVFLGQNDTLPVIISSKLTKEQEDKLVTVLKEHKLDIG